MTFWLDVDTGIDDAVALLAAAGVLPGERFGWVTTVAGNVGLDKVVPNTLRVMAAAGRADVPVFTGADRPLVRDAVDAAYAHGKTGLGSVALPEASAGPAGDLRAAIDRLAAAPDGSVTLVATGPLTNIALVCRIAPDLVRRKLAATVWMGGGRGLGNITAAAEFNAFADPEAAAIALADLSPVVVVDLRTTRAASLTAAEVDALGALGTARGRLAGDLLRDPAYAAGPRVTDRVIVHDAVALLCAVYPGAMFSTTRQPLAVDLSHGPSYGATLVGAKADGPAADMPDEPRREVFVQLLREALA